MTAAVTADVVAFYIYLTKTERNAGLRHVIVYVNVITNSGNRYNKHSGALTAPEAGIFYPVFYICFTLYIVVVPHSYIPVELTLNNY